VRQWRSVVLAASRGPDDPMAKAFQVSQKCTVPVAGKPMLTWVLDALRASRAEQPLIVIENASAIAHITTLETIRAAASAPASAIKALHHIGTYPVLITTGDHPLLKPDIINNMLSQSESIEADILVGLATAETISASYPETKRTYFNLGGTRVSGCNLFAVKTPNGIKLLERWQDLERNRKKPWKLVSAFGLLPILWFALGMLTPDRVFQHISKKLGIIVRPVFLPFAEAAIDVDKPSDHALAEKILKTRHDQLATN
jgi:GTP:adenosylcobinamide-phosphate guanylyltransferase